jgi:hypothetical protein
MLTRSKTRNLLPALYEVNIDFDEASKAWKANKKSIGNGQYKYICLKNNINCKNKCLPGENFCKTHMKK